MSATDGALNGEKLTYLLFDKGPKAAVEGLYQDSNESLAAAVRMYLGTKNCHNPNQHFAGVVNHTWIAVLQRLTKCYDSSKSPEIIFPRAWLRVIGIRCSIEHLREDIKKDKFEVVIDSDEEFYNEEFFSVVRKPENFDVFRQIKENSPEADACNKEALKKVGIYIQKFSQTYQQVYKLHFMGYGYEEISKRFNLKVCTARMIVSRINRDILKQFGRIGGLR